MPTFFISTEVFQNKRSKQYCHDIHYFYQRFIAGPAVSFVGSPTVSQLLLLHCRVLTPIRQSLTPRFPDSMYFLALSMQRRCCHHESKQEPWDNNAMSNPPSVQPNINPTTSGDNTARSPGLSFLSVPLLLRYQHSARNPVFRFFHDPFISLNCAYFCYYCVAARPRLPSGSSWKEWYHAADEQTNKHHRVWKVKHQFWFTSNRNHRQLAYQFRRFSSSC